MPSVYLILAISISVLFIILVPSILILDVPASQPVLRSASTEYMCASGCQDVISPKLDAVDV